MIATAAGELNDSRLHDRCRFWQAALRLQDWDLRLAIQRLGDLGEGTLGDCDASKIKRQARIRLLDPRDIDGQRFWFDGEAWDWEATLVHELLHLHFHDVFPDGWPHGTPTEKAAERAIHAISKALVAAHRGHPSSIELAGRVDAELQQGGWV